MILALLFLAQAADQTETTFNEPSYFVPVILGLLVFGAILWLVAAVLGFVAILGAQQNDFDAVLDFGAFLNIFVVIGAICSIMGFVRLTNPR